MRAFHNDPALKEKYINRVTRHGILDEITKGVYWENGKGCAVGCTIHGTDHRRYATRLGIPVPLAYFEDRIFEVMAPDVAKGWPLRFLAAIPVGVDLAGVCNRFLLWLLEEEVCRYVDRTRYAEVYDATQTTAAMLRRKISGENITPSTRRQVRSAVYTLRGGTLNTAVRAVAGCVVAVIDFALARRDDRAADIVAYASIAAREADNARGVNETAARMANRLEELLAAASIPVPAVD